MIIHNDSNLTQFVDISAIHPNFYGASQILFREKYGKTQFEISSRRSNGEEGFLMAGNYTVLCKHDFAFCLAI